MNPYELMFIVNTSEDEAVDAHIERVGRIIVQEGGDVTGVDKWGKRRFAYVIDDLTEGHYVVMTFKASAPVVNEVGRVLRLADDIVRHLIVRLNEDVVAPAPAESAEPAETQDASSEPAAQEEQSATQAESESGESTESNDPADGEAAEQPSADSETADAQEVSVSTDGATSDEQERV